MTEKDLILDKHFLLDEYQYNLEDELIDDTKTEMVCRLVYEDMLTYIMTKNQDLRGKKKDLIAYLLEDEDRIADFKYAQYKHLYNMIWLDTDDVLQDVYDIIAVRLKLVKINGWKTI